MTESFGYGIYLTVKNYVPDSNMVISTEYQLDGTYIIAALPSQMMGLMESGKDLEIEMDTQDHTIDGVYEGHEPIKMTVTSLNVGKNSSGGLFGVISGEIALIDSLPFLPMEQRGDVYENVLNAGFSVVSSHTTLDSNKNTLYNRLLEENLGI